MKKVRMLRLAMRILQGAILSLFVFLIVFCFYFLLVQNGKIDRLFVFYPFALCTIFLHHEMAICNDPASILLKINRLMFDQYGGYVRHPTETEKEIAEDFFKKKKWKMPILFTGTSIECIACVSSLSGKTFLLVDEHVYRKYSLFQIETVLSHERGHISNGDILLGMIETNAVCLLAWLFLGVALKIIIYGLFFPGILHCSGSFYFLIFLGIALFFTNVFRWCQNILALAGEILADNSAALALDPPSRMLVFLREHLGGSCFFRQRERALLWISRKEETNT